ncbi:MAG: ATP-binding protein [Syntrophobacteraceae bacterium]|jgi:PAS domain S-box-containing protein|nr:ATP-binding protein [Syntrophobacteraceae bacterium]
MVDAALVLGILAAYVCLLFVIALWVERRSAAGKGPADHPLVYSLSLAVYCTAWTYYGSVGKATTSGILFLPIYLGPTVVILLWWTMLRKMVRLKTAHRITSIADFISARYNKSQPLAALVTVISIVGILPYIALQLKAIISTFVLVTTPATPEFSPDPARMGWVAQNVGLVVVVLMVLFTIGLGVRRLDPTERHEGMVTALAVECLVKLVAFLVAGFFVTYVLFDGWKDLFGKIQESPARELFNSWGANSFPAATWATYLVLSMSAVLCLPRQFHVTVVENSQERHILTAMWCFPLYMLLINIFVIPIALGGLIKGFPVERADTFVLLLPLHHGEQWLSLLVFLGGVSAAAGMIMVSSVTMATMITNHLLLPVVEWLPPLAALKRHLLHCRWLVVAGFIFVGFWLEERIFKPYMLVNIGLISFAAFIQLAPALVGGIYWRKANATGAFWGLSVGFWVWCYTQLIPSFVRNGWLPESLLTEGLMGWNLLRPEALFGLRGLDPLTHTVVWSMLFNVGFYVLASLYHKPSQAEESAAEEFVDVISTRTAFRGTAHREAFIDLASKLGELEDLLCQYFPRHEAVAMLERSLEKTGIHGESQITITQLVELQSEVETFLAGSIGSASAYKAIRQKMALGPRESRELSEVYGEMLAHLRLTPSELKSKIDYYREREMLLMRQGYELEEKVAELEREISERKKAQKALIHSEERFRGLVENMNEGLEIEDRNGIIVYVNHKLCQMWGCSREEILGRPASDFLDEGERAKGLQCMAERGVPCTRCHEMTWKGRDDRRIPTIVSHVPIFDDDGSFEGSFSVLTDISEIKGLEREKANIISMFAHDMRSSLTGIHGLGLRLLTKSASMDEEKKTEYLKIINKEASKLEALVDDFLEFSRLETGRLKLNFRAMSLEKELLELHSLYEPRASQKELGLEIVLEDTLPIIEGDVNRLRRVFTNLLDNALKFSKARGKITIIALDTPEEIHVKVRDEGIGIAEEELPYIFDIFHRTPGSEKREGYGIGLATVKAIVEGHGGRVKVESRLGMGTTFTVCLPKKPARSPLSAEPNAA